jgi:hypothetical protein
LSNFGADQIFSGIDDTTGFSWPPDFPGLAWWSDSIDLHLITGSNNPWPSSHYMPNRLEALDGPTGAETRALTLQLATNPMGTGVGQNALEILFDAQETGIEPAPLYTRFWMRPSPEIYEALMYFDSGWHLIWESKTLAHCPMISADRPADPADYEPGSCPSASFRFQLFASGSDEGVQYSYKGESCTENSKCVPLDADGGASATCEDAGLVDSCGVDERCLSTGYSCNNPTHWSATVPMGADTLAKWREGDWMPVEIFVYRNPDDHSDGRFYAAVDDVTVVDETPTGPDGVYGTADDRAFWEGEIFVDPSRNNHPIGFWLMPLYGLSYTDHAVTYDDFELWDGFPCDEPPCGAPTHSE